MISYRRSTAGKAAILAGIALLLLIPLGLLRTLVADRVTQRDSAVQSRGQWLGRPPMAQRPRHCHSGDDRG